MDTLKIIIDFLQLGILVWILILLVRKGKDQTNDDQ